MDNNLSFVKALRGPVKAFNDNSDMEKPEIMKMTINMSLSNHDMSLMSKIMSECECFYYRTGNKPAMIILGPDTYGAMIRHKYQSSCGQLSFDRFSDMQLVLVTQASPEFIEISSGNQDSFLDMQSYKFRPL